MPLVYDDLRRVAHGHLMRHGGGYRPQTTAVVNEAFLRMAGQKKADWKSSSHFLAVAATMVRRVLLDQARSRQRDKRGGGEQDLPLEEAVAVATEQHDQALVSLNDALGALKNVNPRHSRVVELRFMTGLTVEETADVLGVAESTVRRDWQLARSWLKEQLSKERDG